MKISFASVVPSFVFIAISGFLTAADASPIVTALGISSSTGQNWVSNGLTSINGFQAGLDVTVAEEIGNTANFSSDVNYAGGQSQYILPGTTIQFTSTSATDNLGFAGTSEDEAQSIGGNLQADVIAGGGLLIISEVAPAAGTYYLDGVANTATAVDQVLQWSAPASQLAAGGTFVFTSNASALDISGTATLYDISGGPIGFSATSAAPEPSTWALLTGGLGVLGWIIRRRSISSVR